MDASGFPSEGGRRERVQQGFQVVAPLRFAYGRRPGEAVAVSREHLLAQVRAGAGATAGFVEEDSAARIRAVGESAQRLSHARRDGDKAEILRARKRRSHILQDAYLADAHRRVLWSVTQPLGFFERLAFFWTDHFTVSMANRSVRHLVGPFEAEAIRPHVAGDFVTLLRHAALHPAMLFYLDQDRSVGPGSLAARKGRGLNENLAREVIELHTLGVGADYDQGDVRQFAELLTGVTVDRDRGQQVFDERRMEPGSEAVLGRVYGESPADFAAVLEVLADLARHPATARHLAWKLARHFCADDPPEALVRHLESAYLGHDTQLMPVYRALLEHPLAWETFGQKVRQPFDFLVTTLRLAMPVGRQSALEMEQPRAADDGMMGKIDSPRRWPWTLQPLQQMGQLPWSAPGPDGWAEEAEAWISPQGLTERVTFVQRLVRAVFSDAPPEALVTDAFGPGGPDRLALLALEAGARPDANALILLSPELQRR